MSPLRIPSLLFVVSVAGLVLALVGGDGFDVLGVALAALPLLVLLRPATP